MSTIYWALFIGDATLNKTEKIQVLSETIVSQNECLTFKVISYCIILFCILEAGYYFIFFLYSFSEKKSFSVPSHMPIRVMVSYSKKQKKSTLITFKILAPLKMVIFFRI